MHEGAVGALVEQQESGLVGLDARVQPRDQVALDDNVVVLGAANRGLRAMVIEHDLLAEAAQTQAPRPGLLAVRQRNRWQHAGHVLGLPQHLIERDFVAAALQRRDIDLAHRRAPFRRQLFDHRERRDHLSRLGLAGHTICRVHGRAEHVAVLEYHWTEMTADPDGDVRFIVLQAGVRGNHALHLVGGVDRLIRGREGRHDLITHGLDDRAALLLRRRLHDLDADPDHVPRLGIAESLIQHRAADDVGKQDRKFNVFGHGGAIIYDLS